MIKLTSAEDWPSLSGRPPIEVKISSRGLLDGDRRKIAAETGDRFLHEIRKIEHELDRKHMKFAHVISCGATELTGCNRNADGWKAASLAEDMHTYVKHAKAFRDHRNSPEDEYFGLPKYAMYDADRGYGRVLVGYFAHPNALTDKLARVADLELSALDKHGEIKVSHGTKIPHDICVICGNHAATRANYCESRSKGGSCSLFGCKSGLAKVAEDGRMQFVDNPQNRFYDISSIGLTPKSARQADRIAYASPIEHMLGKVAVDRDGCVMGSAWLSEQMQLSPRYDLQSCEGLSPYQEKMLGVAVKLAQAGNGESPIYGGSDSSQLAVLFHADPEFRKAAVISLAGRGKLPGPVAFAKAAGADAATAELVATISQGLLPAIYRRDKLAVLVQQSPYTCSPLSSSISPAMVKVDTPDSLLNERDRFKHAVQSVLPVTDKVASSVDADANLAVKFAMDYAGMKILFAAHFLERQSSPSRFLQTLCG